jgi:ABC-type multidrug transport system fused ATPase/permease subunit
VVSHETYLLHTTVRENLRYAKPDATEAQIEDAAHAAQIHDLIASLRHRGRRSRQPDCEPGLRRGPGSPTVAQNPNSQ